MRGNVSFFNVSFTHYPGDNVLKMFVLSVLRHVCVLCICHSVCEYIQDKCINSMLEGLWKHFQVIQLFNCVNICFSILFIHHPGDSVC